ncbi:MAG: MATE family efflux transporter [Clostridia bacterium]|nr:MATE family efflux transporter [Clostridia bacterium]NCC44631.1 MATE family efflux transporter [Clostridia bacterium]
MNKTKESTQGYFFSNSSFRKLIIPLLIEQVLAITVGVADSMMVASAGEAAMSAVSLVDTVFVLLINLFSALATGGAVICGQYIGKKKPETACRAADQLVLFTGIFSVAVMALAYICKNFILHGVFGNIEAAVMKNCNIYLLIVAASIPFIALYNAGAAIFRSMGDSKTAMYMALVMNGINLIGNAVMIYGLHMGVAGAAIPTLISRIVAAVVIICMLADQKKEVHLELPFEFRFDKNLLKKILGIGIPNGLENSMFQLGKILVLSMASGFGTAAIAANAVCNNIAMFQILPGMAIGFAVLTVVSQCAGAGDYKQVRYYTRKLMKLTYISKILINILVLAALPWLIKLYNLSPEAAGYTKQIIWYHAACVVTIWPLSFSLPNTLRASSDVKYPMILSIISMWVFRIGFSWLLGVRVDMGIFGIWVAMTIDWLFRAICFTIRYFRGRWEISVEG